MEVYMKIFFDSIFGFFALFIMTKVMGKSQIKQITTFDLISALVLGELVGNALYDPKVGVGQILFATTLWTALLYITEQITQKFKRTRAFLEGSPAIIIHKGQIRRDVMKKNKLDMNQLQLLLRSKDIFSLKDVDYAILESDGSISVLKKSLQQNPVRKDLGLVQEYVYLPMALISDGELIKDNLAEADKDETWLKAELKKQNIAEYKEVMYAEYKKGEALYIVTY